MRALTKCRACWAYLLLIVLLEPGSLLSLGELQLLRDGL